MVRPTAQVIKERKKQANEIRKNIEAFEKRFGMSSEDMVKKLQDEPDFKRKLTIAETIWMVEYARYEILMNVLTDGSR
jgi:hypothetical protein